MFSKNTEERKKEENSLSLNQTHNFAGRQPSPVAGLKRRLFPVSSLPLNEVLTLHEWSRLPGNIEASPQWVPLVVAYKWRVLIHQMGMAGKGDIKVYMEKAPVFSFKEVKEEATCYELKVYKKTWWALLYFGKEYKQFLCTWEETIYGVILCRVVRQIILLANEVRGAEGTDGKMSSLHRTGCPDYIWTLKQLMIFFKVLG